MQIWASTKPVGGSLGDHSSHQHASLGEPISRGSLYAQILDAIGVSYRPNQRLQRKLEDNKESAECVNKAQDLEHDSVAEKAATTRRKLFMCALPGCAGEIMERWWQEKSSVAIEKLGWEIAAHVHAAAISVATSNFEAEVLSAKTPFPEVCVAACHRMALKYVVTDEDSKKNDEDCMIDDQAVLEAWREPHGKAKINFAEVGLVKHGMCRLKNLWIDAEQ